MLNIYLATTPQNVFEYLHTYPGIKYRRLPAIHRKRIETDKHLALRPLSVGGDPTTPAKPPEAVRSARS